jgi:serine/threonine-protein kinase RsbW
MPNDEEAIHFDPGPPPRLRLAGEIDFSSADALRSALRDAAERDGDPVIDLSEMTYMDSRGYSVLAEAAKRLRTQGRRLVLDSPSHVVLHTLRLTGLHAYFDLHPSTYVQKARTPRQITGTGGWQHAEFSIPCRVNLLGMARERVMAMARTLAFTEDELSEVELAVGEALSNALRHGCTNDGNQITVECETNGSALTVCVTDPGGGFKPVDVPLPRMEALQEGGMGLHFMGLMMDEVQYDFDERGTTVRLLKIPKHAPTEPT